LTYTIFFFLGLLSPEQIGLVLTEAMSALAAAGEGEGRPT
jgi:hypothetical protein